MYYIQRERKEIDNKIQVESLVEFDVEIALSKSEVKNKNEELILEADFNYNEEGSIDILRAGVFTISWFVTQMTGLSKNGQSFHIQKVDYDVDADEWVRIAGGSSHAKNSSSSGFAIVDVSEAEITLHGKATIGLFNASNASAKLTHHAHAKAGISVTGLNVKNIYERIESIQSFIDWSDVTNVMHSTNTLRGIGAGVIHSGFTYNFWGIGSLDHQQTLSSGSTYYIITSDDYPPLKLYQGDSAAVATLWIQAGGTLYTEPLRFDEKGLYFTASNQMSNLPIGTTFCFTQALILFEA
ncbi:MAG: hypothetical protein FWC79_01355 [Oscillospiraceae bacterium]|nr:hypothetical protein [Oscillospiraceae bacterium]